MSEADEDRFKTETFFDSMEKLGYQAGTLGTKEFLHGLDFLKKQIAAHPHLFVSANIEDAKTGKPLAQPYVIRTYPALHGRPAGKKTIRVAFTGVLGTLESQWLPSVLKADASQVRVTDAAETLKALVPKLQGQADFIVVLGNTDLQESTDIAKAVNGINLYVIGDAVGVYLDEEPVVNGAKLVANGDRARFVAQAMVTLDGPQPKIQTRKTPLSDVYKDNAMVATLRDAYKEKLAALSGGVITEKERTPTAIFFPVAGENHYVGSSVCATCHTEASAQWANSLHMKALVTLQTDKKGINAKRPDCIRCHTVGFGQPSGFTITGAEKDLSGVGCESCHGPGQMHVSQALAGRANPGYIVRAVPQGVQELCVRCHDPANDPKFNFAKAVEKIRHWGPGFTGT